MKWHLLFLNALKNKILRNLNKWVTETLPSLPLRAISFSLLSKQSNLSQRAVYRLVLLLLLLCGGARNNNREKVQNNTYESNNWSARVVNLEEENKSAV